MSAITDNELELSDDELSGSDLELSDDAAGEAKQETEDDKPKRGRAKKVAKSKVDEQAEDAERERDMRDAAKREEERVEFERELAALAPDTKPVRWTIGKPPEMGGTNKTWAVYVQEKLPYMDRLQLFAHITRTMSEAIKASANSGGIAGADLQDFLGDGGGTLIERGRRFSQRDLTDASQFMAMALELMAYSPSFLVDCYVIMLAVPPKQTGWAQKRFKESWDPERDRWGLKEEDHDKIIETFIDQNYEEIRSFFAERLPALGRRVMLHERSKDRASKSDR